MLPDPEIMRNDLGPIKPRHNPDLRGATSPDPEALPAPMSSPSHRSTRKLDVFRNKKVMLGADLKLEQRMEDTIKELVRTGGGDVTREIDRADIFICQYREGEEYVFASQARKDVGNLVWLYHLIAHNAWTAPMRRLLHYPLPRNGIPSFKEYKISLSNYSGEARIYLENPGEGLRRSIHKDYEAGQHPSHHGAQGSDKCDAAHEWGTHILNHLWLEESYAHARSRA